VVALLCHGDPQHAEQFPHRQHIDDLGHIRQHTLAATEDRGGQDR
jgi:hypothetical protein